VGRKGNVGDGDVTAVHDGGDAACATKLAGGTLSEIGTGSSVDYNL
jgi:hypothetical protein